MTASKQRITKIFACLRKGFALFPFSQPLFRSWDLRWIFTFVVWEDRAAMDLKFFCSFPLNLEIISYQKHASARKSPGVSTTSLRKRSPFTLWPMSHRRVKVINRCGDQRTCTRPPTFMRLFINYSPLRSPMAVYVEPRRSTPHRVLGKCPGKLYVRSRYRSAEWVPGAARFYSPALIPVAAGAPIQMPIQRHEPRRTIHVAAPPGFYNSADEAMNAS